MHQYLSLTPRQFSVTLLIIFILRIEITSFSTNIRPLRLVGRTVPDNAFWSDTSLRMLIKPVLRASVFEQATMTVITALTYDDCHMTQAIMFTAL
jgi:hypothetical protein